MKALLGFCLAVSASLNACTAGSPNDAQAVQGSWKPVQAELAGQAMSDTVLKSISLKLENGQYDVSVAGAADKGTYTIDAASTPKGMSITGVDGPNKGKTYPAIYQLAGDTLRICYNLSGSERPTEFKSVAGTMLYLVTYARQKQ
jgi:uncharacterized protein (TIGR03067 family)